MFWHIGCLENRCSREKQHKAATSRIPFIREFIEEQEKGDGVVGIYHYSL